MVAAGLVENNGRIGQKTAYGPNRQSRNLSCKALDSFLCL